MLEKAITQELGPRAMAEKVSANIAELQSQLEAADIPREAKRLRKLLKLNRDLLKWCKTRAGY